MRHSGLLSTNLLRPSRPLLRTLKVTARNLCQVRRIWAIVINRNTRHSLQSLLLAFLFSEAQRVRLIQLPSGSVYGQIWFISVRCTSYLHRKNMNVKQQVAGQMSFTTNFLKMFSAEDLETRLNFNVRLIRIWLRLTPLGWSFVFEDLRRLTVSARSYRSSRNAMFANFFRAHNLMYSGEVLIYFFSLT